MRRLFALVTAVQAADAQAYAPRLAERLNASVASSAQPSTGPREEGDEMLSIVKHFVAPLGTEPSRWAGDDMQRAFEVVRDLGVNLCATGGEEGFTAELPFLSESSLLRAVTTDANPYVGHGLLLLLSIPLTFRIDEGVPQAHELNRRGLESCSGAHFLGSWCWHNDFVTHCSFFPNAMRLGGADLINLVLSSVGRARWVAESIYGDDWKKNRNPSGRPLAQPVPMQMMQAAASQAGPVLRSASPRAK